MNGHHIKEHEIKVKWLVTLAACTIVFGAILLKTSTNHQLRGVPSSASETLPHWPHEKTPAPIRILDRSTKNWASTLNNAIDSWESSSSVEFSVEGITGTGPCPNHPEVINFCSYYDKNDPTLAYSAYVYNESGHIVLGVLEFNDVYFNNPSSPYSTQEWKDYYMCQFSGTVLGLPIRYIPVEESKSCMNGIGDPDYTHNQVDPDGVDLEDLKTRYSHVDDVSSSAVAYKSVIAGELLAKRDFGQMVKSFNNGQEQIFENDLGDGYKMRTLAVFQN